MAKEISKETFEEYKRQVIIYLQDIIGDIETKYFYDYEKQFENEADEDAYVAEHALMRLRDYFTLETWKVEEAVYDMIDESAEIRGCLVIDRAEREVMADDDREAV